MIIFEVLRTGHNFAITFRKTFSSASFSYAQKMHSYQEQRLAMDEDVSAPPKPKKYLVI
ncbi:MAG: hypothetical protein AB2693_15590 [Candidatus Thiodiazotropha sp.]